MYKSGNASTAGWKTLGERDWALKITWNVQKCQKNLGFGEKIEGASKLSHWWTQLFFFFFFFFVCVFFVFFFFHRKGGLKQAGLLVHLPGLFALYTLEQDGHLILPREGKRMSFCWYLGPMGLWCNNHPWEKGVFIQTKLLSSTHPPQSVYFFLSEVYCGHNKEWPSIHEKKSKKSGISFISTCRPACFPLNYIWGSLITQTISEITTLFCYLLLKLLI